MIFCKTTLLTTIDKKLRTILLDKTNELIKKECEEGILEASYVTLLTDGWSYIRQEHLVNCMPLIPS